MAEFEKSGEIPASASVGDAVALKLLALSALYPAGSFTMTLSARLNGGSGAGADVLALNFAADGDTQTGTLDFTGKTAGTWSWAIKADDGSDARIVERGTLFLNADPSTADVRSHGERMLTAIEALLEGRAVKDVNSYAIAGRSLQRMTVKELMDWRSHYKSEVARERGRGKPNGGRSITYARFN